MINLQNRKSRSALFAVIATVGSLISSASFAGPSYDGVWSVLVHTEKGDCDPGYRYPIRIANGHLINAGEFRLHHQRRGCGNRGHHRDGGCGWQERQRIRPSRRCRRRRFLERRRLLGFMDRGAPGRVGRI